jgi:ParB-like chromosome segregation protein Spo0J
VNLLPSKYELVKASALELHPDNARRGNLDRLIESVRVNGFYGAIVAQKSTRHILVGNHRYQAAVALGIEELPVLWVDIDDAEARRMLLVDNRSNDLASYDDELLVELLKLAEQETGLEGSGFNKDDLAMLEKLIDKNIEITDSLDGGAMNLGEKFEVLIECENEYQQTMLLERLSLEGLKVKAIVI